jgi:hypothetical protein
MAWLQTRQKYIALWSAELQETMGVIARDFQRGCRILGSFARQNPVKFDPEQWDEIAEATRLISKARRLIQLRRQPPMRSCGDTENLSEEELLALFLEMAAWVEASSSSEDDTEERHDAS